MKETYVLEVPIFVNTYYLSLSWLICNLNLHHLPDWYSLCPRPKFYFFLNLLQVLKNKDKCSDLFLLTIKSYKSFPPPGLSYFVFRQQAFISMFFTFRGFCFAFIHSQHLLKVFRDFCVWLDHLESILPCLLIWENIWPQGYVQSTISIYFCP